jgi:hypothetical protein
MFENNACFRPLLATATLAAALAAGFSACSPADSTDLQDFSDETDTVDHASTELSSTGRRYITNHPLVGCKTPPDLWEARLLFEYPGVPTPPALLKYCLYTWQGKARPTAAQRAALVTAINPMLMTYAPVIPVEDPVVMGPLGFAQESRAFLRDRVREHAGAMAELPQGAQAPFKTRIAFPDTSPEETSGLIPDGRMAHGSILGWLARELSSSPGLAPVTASHVTTGIALPQVDNDKEDLLQGGYFGTRGQLAEAIYRVTAAWRAKAEDPTNPQPRLVVNLSVGWEPTDGCSKATGATSLQVPARAVFEAITHANCMGAAVIAAAGNYPGKDAWGKKVTVPDEPVCPAAWAQLPAPTLDKCQTFMGNSKYDGMYVPFQLPVPARSVPADGIDNPLLFAVGGVDFGRRRIDETRANAFPKHAAIATHASAAPAGKDLPPSITGTSVASAVVSAIAGTAWAYRPELTAPELMNVVYWTGQSIGQNSSFGTTTPTQVRAASLCHTLRVVCAPNAQGQVPPACPSQLLTCSYPKPSPDANPPLPARQIDLLEDLFKLSTRIDVNVGPDLLGNPAPNESFPAACVPPWVYPQPIRPPCGACAFKLNRDLGIPALDVLIDSGFDGTLSLGDTTLILRTGWNTFTNVGPLGTGTLRQGSQITVNLPGLNVTTVYSASLAWKSWDANGRATSFTERILVTP